MMTEAEVRANATANAKKVVLPLGFTALPDDLAEVEKEEEGYVEGEEGTSSTVKEREEWLLTPGESKAFAVLDGVLTNRKFQSGKQAKKVAEKHLIQKAYMKSVEESASSHKRQQSTGEDDEDNHKPSLFDEHLAKRVKLDESNKKASQGKHERKAFDREADVLSHKKLNIAEVQKLVSNSKELNSKFDKAIVQRSFI